MRTFTLILSSLLLLGAPLHAGERCSAPARECEIQIREMLGGQRFLGVTLRAAKVGVLVKSVVHDSPADRAGFRSDDLFIAINGRDVSRADIRAVKKLLQQAAEQNDGKLNILVTRYGDVRRLHAEMGRMPEEQIKKVIQAHLREAHGENGTGH